MGVRILYGDVAPEAKESFVPSTENQALYEDKLSDLQSNAVFPNYLNPCEKYSVMLDGTALLLPETVTTEKIGLISKDITNSNGAFTTPLVLTLTAEGLYSSQGFTFTFDTDNNIYPKSITIDWYDTTVSSVTPKATQTFTPTNAFYFCKKQVQYFDKVEITFPNLNMPYNRLRLKCIDYGYGTYLEAGELRNVKIIQQLNPISSQIEINTGDFVLDSLRDIPYNFQAKQPLTIYFNDNIQQVVFIKKATRNSERLWNIQAEDYISMLEGVNFYGGIYGQDTSNPDYATTIINSIFATARVPYTITNDFDNIAVVGHIPICTCREALMQVLFAIGAVCDTSGESVPKIYKLANTVTQTIPLDRIRQGQKVIDDETVTGVSVTSHTYVANASTEPTELYNAEESGISEVIDGVAQPIFVQFSNPCHTLNFNASYGSIVESSANYAIIIVTNANFVLTGKEYEHTTAIKSQNNPLILASDMQNIASVENATLISKDNVDNILEICYDYYVNRKNMSVDIREGKTQNFSLFDEAQFDVNSFDFSFEDEVPVKVGEKITAKTPDWQEDITGRIEKQTYSLIGNIIWKQCEVH